MVLVKASALDLSKVTFSDVKTDNHGRKMVYVNYNNGKIMVQTPKMYAPNGIKRWRKKDATDNKDDKFEMELSFYEAGNDKNAQEIRECKEKWQEFDELLKDKIIEKAREWLSMPKLDKSTLENVMYTPMVRVPKDKEGNELPYPSRLRAKIDRDFDTNGVPSGRFLSNKKFKADVLFFDESKETITVDEDNAENAVPKGSQVVCILELVYLSLSKTTISTKWKLVQAKVFRNKDTITGYAMLDDEDSASTGAKQDLDTDDAAEVSKGMDNLDVGGDEAEDEESEAEDEEEEAESEAEVVVEVEMPKPTAKTTKSRAKRAVAV